MATLHTMKKTPAETKDEQSSEVKQAKSAPEIAPVKTSQPNEGEGNTTAARHYDEGVEAYVESGRSDAAAKAAEAALKGPEAEQLRAAEEFGKAGKPKVKGAKSSS